MTGVSCSNKCSWLFRLICDLLVLVGFGKVNFLYICDLCVSEALEASVLRGFIEGLFECRGSIVPAANCMPSSIVNAVFCYGWYVADSRSAMRYPKLVIWSLTSCRMCSSVLICVTCCGLISGESWMYLLMASDPHLPMSCTASML